MSRLVKIPRKDEVHVWQASLEVSEASLRELQDTLSDDEKRRAERYLKPADQARFIAGKGVLRDILAGYLAVEPTALTFGRNKHGKPKLADDHPLRFNVSHSFDKLVLVFAIGREVGVDIELIREMPNAEQIVRHFFTLKEQREYYALAEDSRLAGFFTCWTRKEAYIKALGRNLHSTLDKISVSLNDDDLSISPGNPDANAADWSMQMISPQIQGCIGAIVSQGNDWVIRSFKYD